jgi:glycosyltransferase involved in cell wall biosynthesis
MDIRTSVLHVGKFYPPFRGGMESHLHLLCRDLQRAIDIRIVVSAATRRGSRELIDGIELTRLGTPLTIAGASLSFGMRRRIADSAADIVHLHLPNPTAILAYLASGRRGHLVATYHSDIVRQKVLGAAFAPFLRRFLRMCDAIIVSSQDYLESSPVLAAFRTRCHIIPYGIDPGPYRNIQPSLIRGIRDSFGSRIILAVGRMIGYKGFKHLINAMPNVRGHLLLVGDGPLRAKLTEQASRLRVAGRITFLGPVEDVAPYLHVADVFVLPSVTRAEAFGIVQLEAMACETPVVNTSLDSGVPFVSRHEETGLTVAPADPGALAIAINRLLDDPGLRQRFGCAARRRVETEFTANMMASRTLDLYQDVMRRTVPLNT